MLLKDITSFRSCSADDKVRCERLQEPIVYGAQSDKSAQLYVMHSQPTRLHYLEREL